MYNVLSAPFNGASKFGKNKTDLLTHGSVVTNPTMQKYIRIINKLTDFDHKSVICNNSVLVYILFPATREV